MHVPTVHLGPHRRTTHPTALSTFARLLISYVCLSTVCTLTALRRKQHVLFEYTLLQGVNDGMEQARELVSLVQDINCHINLMYVPATHAHPSATSVSTYCTRPPHPYFWWASFPLYIFSQPSLPLMFALPLAPLLPAPPAPCSPFNPWPGAPYTGSDDDTIRDFGKYLLESGIPTSIRWPKGKLQSTCRPICSSFIVIIRAIHHGGLRSIALCRGGAEDDSRVKWGNCKLARVEKLVFDSIGIRCMNNPIANS